MSAVQTKAAGVPCESRMGTPELDAPCDFTAYLAERLGVESHPAALHILGLLLLSYQPIERRPINVLEFAPSRRRARVGRRHRFNSNALRHPGEGSLRQIQIEVNRPAPHDDRRQA